MYPDTAEQAGSMANGHNGILQAPRSVLSALAASEPGESGFHADYDMFHRSQYGDLVGFLRKRLRTQEDAEDAAQESLSRLLRCANAEPRAAWKPLLYRIAINIAHDRLRSARRHHADQHVPLEDQEIDADHPGPEEVAARLQAHASLREAVLALPPKCRQVYLLRLVRGLSTAEVARHCGISTRTVEKHLTNALSRVRARVGETAAGEYQV